MDEGDEITDDTKAESSSAPSQRRPAGAYYKGIERKMLLKKKRVNVSVSPDCSDTLA